MEGLVIIGIEAQVTGLSCLFSNNSSKEIEVTKLCKFIKLDIEEWKTEILNWQENLKNKRYYLYKIENSALELTKYYYKI